MAITRYSISNNILFRFRCFLSLLITITYEFLGWGRKTRKENGKVGREKTIFHFHESFSYWVILSSSHVLLFTPTERVARAGIVQFSYLIRRNWSHLHIKLPIRWESKEISHFTRTNQPLDTISISHIQLFVLIQIEHDFITLPGKTSSNSRVNLLKLKKVIKFHVY